MKSRTAPIFVIAALIAIVPARADSIGALSTSPAPLITTTGPPINYEIFTPEFFSVSYVSSAAGQCSGALLSGGAYVLSAAHCFTNADGTLRNDPVSAWFFTDTNPGGLEIQASAIDVHPGWQGLGTNNSNLYMIGNDLAILTLSQTVNLPGYQISRDLAAGGVNTPAVVAGYGLTGEGATGEVSGSGVLRAGRNTMDAYWSDLIPGAASSIYAWDFDRFGDSTTDAIGLKLGGAYVHTGLTDEVLAALGDSGGPTFFRNAQNQLEIAAVHSFGWQLFDSGGSVIADVSPLVQNASYGEVAGDARVAVAASWIDQVTGVAEPVPEPSAFVLMGAGLALVLLRRRRS